MKSLWLLFTLPFACISTLAQNPTSDALPINYTYPVEDYFGNNYKYLETQNGNRIEYIYQNDTLVLIDTTVYSDLRRGTTPLPDKFEKSLINYYQKFVKSPKHGGDPNWCSLSIVTNKSGHIVQTRVIENVQNACDSSWQLTPTGSFILQNSKIKKDNLVEYIVRFDDVCYCICDASTEIKHENKKRFWPFRHNRKSSKE